MSRPLLTIAIPTYNRADLLDLCLGKILDQLGPHARLVELLVSNNASTDHTRQVVARYQKQYAALGYSENEQNGGPDVNIAKCFELATAKYVWVFSDDDIILPGALDHIVPFLDQHELGVLLLKPSFYRSSVYEFVPEKGPLVYKFYDDPKALITQHHFWLTYISGVITNKDLVLNEPALYRYQNSFMIQLGWVLPALLRAQQNAEITSSLILTRVLEVPDFRLFYVFGVSYPQVLTSMATNGTIPAEVKELLINLVITDYFKYHIESGASKAAYRKERPLLMLGKAFWKRPAFWTTLAPVFVRRGVRNVTDTGSSMLDKVLSRVAFRLVNLAAGRKAALVISSLKRLGAHSTLPEGHTLRNPQCIEIGNYFQALSAFVIEAHTTQGGESFAPAVVIGNHVTFGSDCRLDCCQTIRLGDWVLVGHRVLIADNERDDTTLAVLTTPPANRKLRSQGGITIADYVLIEDGVRIFSGVSIGQNSIIKADAVVRESVPANSVVAGNPARVIRQLIAGEVLAIEST